VDKFSRPARRLLPEGLQAVGVVPETSVIVLRTRATASYARCPTCGLASGRVHSRYTRSVSDLPWRGIAVKVEVRARRFFCDREGCKRRIFCERLPEIAARARKTGRLEEALLAIALELGGEAGARLAQELGLVVSPDVFLDRIRRGGSDPECAARRKVRVLGVDDFAFRRGDAYGTILVDLERRRVVDLLPDRSADALTAWLSAHPGVEVVSRDRFPAYADAISPGAPGATQVADRWHLAHNLAETLDEFLVGKRPTLKAAAVVDGGGPAADDEAARGEEEDVASPGPMTPNRPRLWYARQQEAAKRRHERLIEQWREIRRLQEAGADVADIARRLGISRRTVYRYKDLAEPPERSRHHRRATVLDPYVPYILGRWEEGCRNGMKLFREIRERGYAHGASNVGRLVAELRRNDGLGRTNGERRGAPRPQPPPLPPGTWRPCSCAARRSFPRNRERT
jgi:transposase